jgi:pyruvate kinase
VPRSRRTKIVATIGPASDPPDVLAGLFQAGADVARLALAHDPIDSTLARLKRVRDAAARVERPIGVLADLPGPKVRTAPFQGQGVIVMSGEEIRLVDAEPGDTSTKEVVAVELAGATGALQPGDHVALGDGGVRLVVERVDNDGVTALLQSTGRLRGRPGVSLPADRVPLVSPTDADLEMLEHLTTAEVDWLAVSFVQSADDVAAIRFAAGNDGPGIIAKIETGPAVIDIDDILATADGVMVARGDLGVRLPMEDVPHIQKRIIRKGVAFGKPVITATQMLESMLTSPVPTRAEVTDVANAVFDGTSAVMLSGETAVGHDPIAAVSAMATITRRAEREFDYEAWGTQLGRQQLAGLHDAPATTRITSAITAAAWRASVDAELAAIIACTNNGRTATMISRFRPTCPILAMTPSQRTARQLAMAWGIRPVVVAEHGTTDEIVWHAVERASQLGVVRRGDVVGVLVGSPMDEDPTTDVLRLVRVR